MSKDEFYDYWHNKHGQLVAQYASTAGIKRYIQSHTIASDLNDLFKTTSGTTDCYDGIAELWFDSRDAFLAASGIPEAQEANALIFADAQKFIDFSSSCIFFTEEHNII
jgi:uncharacterized protein (TIGR02118 family)